MILQKALIASIYNWNSIQKANGDWKWLVLSLGAPIDFILRMFLSVEHERPRFAKRAIIIFPFAWILSILQIDKLNNENGDHSSRFVVDVRFAFFSLLLNVHGQSIKPISCIWFSMTYFIDSWIKCVESLFKCHIFLCITTCVCVRVFYFFVLSNHHLHLIFSWNYISCVSSEFLPSHLSGKWNSTNEKSWFDFWSSVEWNDKQSLC